MCIIVSEHSNLYFLDVQATYFDGYRDVLDPIYKHPKGLIKEYTKGYKTPSLDPATQDKIDIEGKKFLMKSNAEWKAVRYELQRLNRRGVSVSIQNLFLYVQKFTYCYNSINKCKKCNKV